jgi:CDP-diglyceride synthetase
MDAKRVIARIAGPILGAVLAVFGVFASIFADGGNFERVITILVVALVYGVVAAGCAMLDRSGAKFALYVWLPAPVVVIAYILNGEWSVWAWGLFVLATTGGASLVGAVGGTVLGRRLFGDV